VTMLLHQVIHDEPRPPRRLNHRVPRDLETICLKAMEKVPGRRYATAAALAQDLRRWLDGKPIHARAVRGWERTWKWAKRNPVVATLTAAVALTLIGGATVASGFALQLQLKNRDLQETNTDLDDANQELDQRRQQAEKDAQTQEQLRK